MIESGSALWMLRVADHDGLSMSSCRHQTGFTLSASSWVDDASDYPLSYSYTYKLIDRAVSL